MARKTNATSTRQLAFARLDTMTGIGRKDAAETLMSEFNIKRPYAMTIYQQHRNELKKSGAYTAVFTVRDIKDNKPITPFISTTHVLKPGKSDALTPDEAVAFYCTTQHVKIQQAQDMELPVLVKPEAPAEKTDTTATAEKATEAPADETPTAEASTDTTATA